MQDIQRAARIWMILETLLSKAASNKEGVPTNIESAAFKGGKQIAVEGF